MRALVAALNDPDVAACVAAERAVSAGLGADCSAPLGAYAEWSDGVIQLNAVLASPDGRQVLRASSAGRDPAALGGEVVASLVAGGARDILAGLA